MVKKYLIFAGIVSCFSQSVFAQDIRFETPDQNYSVQIKGYLQGQFQTMFLESAPNTDTFRVRRARLGLSGHLYSKNVQYELEYDFSSSTLLEAFLQLVHSDVLKFRVGQYHVPFSYEMMSSSSNLQLVERSIVNALMGIPNEREPGAGFVGTLADQRLEYSVGAFNGEGINTVNQNKGIRVAGRLMYRLMGQNRYDYSDLANSADPQAAIGFAAMYNDTSAPFASKVTSIATDITAKTKGFSVHGEFLFHHTKAPTFAGNDQNDFGWLVQGGYFLLPKKLEVAARAAQVNFESFNDQGEYTVGVNFFPFEKNTLKFQADYGFLTIQNGIAPGNDELDQFLRVQLQFKI